MRKLFVLLMFLPGCMDATNTSLVIPFALFATDELSASSSGICGFSPLLQAQGAYKSTGFLELDPDINPNPEYVLGLQIENYLAETVLTDSEGNTVEGVQRNDFALKTAQITYLDLGGNLSSVTTVFVDISGTVRVGGEQNATAVAIRAVDPSVAQSWQQSLAGGSLPSEEVILQVQIFGNLASGQDAQTGIFNFPLTLCVDCGGISPTAPVGASNACPQTPFHTTPVPSGHGPCCASQDFTETCVACGGTGQACCAATPACGTQASPGSCSGAPTSQGELCAYPNQVSVVCK